MFLCKEFLFFFFLQEVWCFSFKGFVFFFEWFCVCLRVFFFARDFLFSFGREKDFFKGFFCIGFQLKWCVSISTGGFDFQRVVSFFKIFFQKGFFLTVFFSLFCQGFFFVFLRKFCCQRFFIFLPEENITSKTVTFSNKRLSKQSFFFSKRK